MEQRRLRLGDILDDYCPRERRVTNHAVVAMIEEDVKQTRCTTCDAEHAYKGARVPKRRKKETPAALYKEVLAGMPEVEEAPLLAAALPAAAVAATVTCRLWSPPSWPRRSTSPRRVQPPSKNRRHRRPPRAAAPVTESIPQPEAAEPVRRRYRAAVRRARGRWPGPPPADSRNPSACRRPERRPSDSGLHRPSCAGPGKRTRWLPRRPRCASAWRQCRRERQWAGQRVRSRSSGNRRPTAVHGSRATGRGQGQGRQADGQSGRPGLPQRHRQREWRTATSEAAVPEDSQPSRRLPSALSRSSPRFLLPPPTVPCLI